MAVECRAVAVAGGGRVEEEGYRRYWQTINRVYQDPAVESCAPMAPCQIHREQTHTVYSMCVCVKVSLCLCLDGCVPDQRIQTPFL